MTSPHTRADALRAALVEIAAGDIPGDDGDLVLSDKSLAVSLQRMAELAIFADDARLTRLATPSEQTPEVSALGSPGVPREAIELLAWQLRRTQEHPTQSLVVSIELCHEPPYCEVETYLLNDGALDNTVVARSLAEAARAALEKVSR